MAMREDVYAQALGASTFLGRTGEQWRCQSSTTSSRGSLERRIMLLFNGERHTLTQLRDKMEIPVDFSLCRSSPPTAIHNTSVAVYLGIRLEQERRAPARDKM
jgi:hypothetical protein